MVGGPGAVLLALALLSHTSATFPCDLPSKDLAHGTQHGPICTRDHSATLRPLAWHRLLGRNKLQVQALTSVEKPATHPQKKPPSGYSTKHVPRKVQQ